MGWYRRIKGDWYQIRHTIGMHLCSTAIQRAAYLKKHDIFSHMGDNCMTMFRKVPLHPKLISLGDNVWIASDVLLISHDVIHRMLNNKLGDKRFQEFLGCIDIKDNVFIGSRSTILPNVTIGSNTIIAAGSVVNHDIPGNGVWGGVPAKYICSLDEFMAKRDQYPKVNISRGEKGLSDDTVKACWERFDKLKKDRGT